MAWEKRGNREYYYRKRRVGKTVVSEYFGAGELAELFAEMDAYDRLALEQERNRFNQEKTAQLEIDHEIDKIGRNVLALTRGRLLAAGYRTHKGQWRKKRGG